MSEVQPRGVHLTDKHIVFGVMTATAVVVIAFLCGVFVGRGVLALRPSAAELGAADNRIVPDVPSPAAEADAGGAYGGDASRSVALPPDKLTYPDRLGKAEPSRETLKGASAEPGPPVPPPDAPGEPGDQEARPASAVPAAAVGPAPVGEASADGDYTVQIAAVRIRTEAQAIVDKLKKKGYPAYVFVPPSGEPRGGFRVRVGAYKSRREADPMATRLQKEGYKPWITR